MSCIIRHKVREEKGLQTTQDGTKGNDFMAEYLRRAKNGDYIAFGEIYSVYVDQIYRYILYHS